MSNMNSSSSARFRQRKISVKQTLQVLWQSDLPDLEDEQQRDIQQVETGVEKGEEEVSLYTCTRAKQFLTLQYRNTIYKLPLMLPLLLHQEQRLSKFTFPRRMLQKYGMDILNTIRRTFWNLARTFGYQLQLKKQLDARIAWMRPMRSF